MKECYSLEAISRGVEYCERIGTHKTGGGGLATVILDNSLFRSSAIAYTINYMYNCRGARGLAYSSIYSIHALDTLNINSTSKC